MPGRSEIFQRTYPLMGSAGMERLGGLRVLVAGVGGVGSWCAEALARSGVGHITLLDDDRVAVSNINRQLPATTATVGQPKVEVMARRLREINPEIDCRPLMERYTPETAGRFDPDSYDYVIDAIDSLQCKAALILNATASRATLFSSMGAARKLHPSQIATAPFLKVTGCPLARALRTYFRRNGLTPSRPFQCVFSPERLPHREEPAEAGVNGTFMHTTAIFGLTLASLVVEAEYSR